MGLPNTEGILIAALKAAPAVKTLAGSRVVPELPAVKTWPAVRVVRFGGVPAVQNPLTLDQADIQVDVWAATKQAAFDLVDAVRDVSANLPGVHPLGSVAHTRVGVLQYAPDTVFDPAVPRYILDVTVWAKHTTTR